MIKSKPANPSRLPQPTQPRFGRHKTLFFASDQSFARKAVRETGTRRCRQNTYASCIRQHRVEEHDVLIGDHGHGVSCGTWCVSVAGEANFGDHTDLINLVAAGEGIMLEAQFLFEEAHGAAALGFVRGAGPGPARGSAPVRIGGGVVQGPSFAAGGRFPEDLRVGAATAEGARRPFQPTLRLRAGASHFQAADGRTSAAGPAC